jgi:DNA polymerase-1
MTAERKDLILIDANSLVHRCFHALPPLTTSSGEPAQALYGMASIFLRMWKNERPAYAAALFDRPEPTLRKKRYPEYKATRPPTADELVAQLIAAHDLFPAFGIKTFEAPGYEADDLIATLAERFGGTKNVRVVILTGDTDTLQLVDDDRVVVRAFRTGLSDTVIYDDKAVRERYGLAPEQLPDYKALVGDTSDNIRGVPGIGPKTARELLTRFKTLDETFQRMPKEDAKRAARFMQFREQANEARELVLLERHAPLGPVELAELAVPEGDAGAIAYLERQGFTSLIRRLMEPQGKSAGWANRTKQKPDARPQGALF